MSSRAIDVHALPAMLTTLRLPSFHRHWQALAARADTEAWPAARFLAALAEIELAERETRRIRRHLLEANLPPGKTTTTTDSSTKFTGAARAGSTVRGESVALHRGRTTHVWQTTITGDDGRLCAVVTQTQLVIDARAPG